MQEAQLRAVLLVKAIEETDATDFLIPAAERDAATREARRNTGQTLSEGEVDSALRSRAQRMLVERAAKLLPAVIERQPYVAEVANLARGPAWIGWALVGISVLAGAGLSAIDGARHIDILSFPLLGLVLWNVLVYAAVLVGTLRRTSHERPRRHPLARVMAGRIFAKAQRLVHQSAKFNAPLAKALDQFTREWLEIAKPLLVTRALRLFHLCAAAAGLGMIIAVYMRGLTVDYTAGWESTFLDADDVKTLVSIVYGPASALRGITLPDAPHLAAIRWQNGGGGERAAYWIHLVATTVALFIVLPRLVLAAVQTLAVWRLSLRAALPPPLTGYFRKVFGAEIVPRDIAITVFPYAYDPAETSVSELQRLFSGALGASAAITCRSPLAYGQEDAFPADGGGEGELRVLLFNLAATPEDENHGAVIHRLRARAAAGTALVVVDEGPYAARMQSAGGAPERMAERRRLWRDFVDARGFDACFVNSTASATSDSDLERLRTALASGSHG